MARSQMQMAQTRRLYNYGLPLLRHKQCFGCCWQYLKSKLLIIKIFLHSYLAEQRYKILFIQYVKEHLILTFYTTSPKEGNGDTTDWLNYHQT